MKKMSNRQSFAPISHTFWAMLLWPFLKPTPRNDDHSMIVSAFVSLFKLSKHIPNNTSGAHYTPTLNRALANIYIFMEIM